MAASAEAGLPVSPLGYEEMGRLALTAHEKKEVLPKELEREGWVVWKTFDQFFQEKEMLLKEKHQAEGALTIAWRYVWAGWEKYGGTYHYAATAFYNPKRNIAVIGNKGSTDLYDLFCDTAMLAGLPPLDHEWADQFADHVGEWANSRKFTLIHIGFSKGADHTALVAYRRGEAAYLIDPFRMQTIMENRFGKPLDRMKLSRFWTFLSEPNAINYWRGPVGNVLRIHFSPAEQKEIDEIMEKFSEAKQLDRLAAFTGEGPTATGAGLALQGQHVHYVHCLERIVSNIRPSNLTLEVACPLSVIEGEGDLLPSKVAAGYSLFNTSLEEMIPLHLFSLTSSPFFPNIQVQVAPGAIDFTFDLLHPNALKRGQAFTTPIEDFVQTGAYIPITEIDKSEAIDRIDREVFRSITMMQTMWPKAILTYPLNYPRIKDTRYNYILGALDMTDSKHPGAVLFYWKISNDSGLFQPKGLIYLIAGCTPPLAPFCVKRGWTNMRIPGIEYHKDPVSAYNEYAQELVQKVGARNRVEEQAEKLRQAKEATEKQDYAAALSLVKEIYQSPPNKFNSFELVWWLGFLYAKVGRVGEAAELFAKEYITADPLSSDPAIRTVGRICLEAKIFLYAGRYGEALQRIKEYCTLTLNKPAMDENMLLSFALYLFDQNQDAMAHDLLKNLNTPAAAKTQASFFFKRAYQALGKKELEPAMALLRESLARDPENCIIILFLASLHWYKKQWKEALLLVDKLLDKEPDRFPSLHLKAELLRHELDPKTPFPSLRFMGYVKSKQLTPKQLEEFLGLQGVMAFALGAYLQKDVQGAKALLEAFPEEPNALRFRIVIAREEKDEAAIISCSTKLLSIVPKDVAVLRLLHEVYTHQYAQTKTTTEKAKLLALRLLVIAADPTYPALGRPVV